MGLLAEHWRSRIVDVRGAGVVSLSSNHNHPQPAGSSNASP
jgi:hypothetical protein